MLNEGSKPLTATDVYERLWKCRDFELTTLWQRSAMLGVFLALSYTGYGALWIAMIGREQPFSWTVFNLLALGLTFLGSIFATLWIMMAKGSKAWYEHYEAALSAFKESEAPTERGAFAHDGVRAIASFAVTAIPGFADKLPKLNDSLWSYNAGRYSPSKVMQAIGILSLAGWMFIGGAHVFAIWCGHDFLCFLVDRYALGAAFILLILVYSFIFLWLTGKMRSSVLE